MNIAAQVLREMNASEGDSTLPRSQFIVRVERYLIKVWFILQIYTLKFAKRENHAVRKLEAYSRHGGAQSIEEAISRLEKAMGEGLLSPSEYIESQCTQIRWRAEVTMRREASDRCQPLKDKLATLRETVAESNGIHDLFGAIAPESVRAPIIGAAENVFTDKLPEDDFLLGCLQRDAKKSKLLQVSLQEKLISPFKKIEMKHVKRKAFKLLIG